MFKKLKIFFLLVATSLLCFSSFGITYSPIIDTQSNLVVTTDTNSLTGQITYHISANNISTLNSNIVINADISLNTAKVKTAIENILQSNKTVRILGMGDSMTQGGDSGQVPNNQSTFYSFINDLSLSYSVAGGQHGLADPRAISWFGNNQAYNSSLFSPAWIGNNWWVLVLAGINTNFLFPQYGNFTNVDTIEVAWVQQPSGGVIQVVTNANGLGQFHDLLTVSGFSPVWKTAYTNIPLSGLQNINVAFSSTNGTGVTNLIMAVSAYNSTRKEIIPYMVAQGGDTITNMLNCGTNMWGPLLQGINPDLIIYHAKDVGENGTEPAGLNSAFTALYNSLSPFTTNAQWVIVGDFDDSNIPMIGGTPQNEIMRRLCITNGWTYVDAWLPTNIVNYYNASGGSFLHPNLQTANWGGGKISEQLGLRPKGYTESAYPLFSHPINGSGLTNIIKGNLVFTNFLLGTTFTNTTGIWIHVHGAVRGTPTTTLGAQLAMGVSTNLTGAWTYTNVAAGALEADTIFSTSPNVWEAIDDDVPPGGRWQFFEYSGNSTIAMTNSFYRKLQ